MIDFLFGEAKAFARLIVRVGACLMSSACLTAAAQSTVPGKVPAEFSVSPSGAAVYRIPIQVPPGVAGMEPKLALVYNSQAGNGILGMGWSLDGLSAITRCPKTMATDGVTSAINHTAEDRFCMDGQRLINVAGGYGAPGSEYRTEMESFSKVIANGSAANNAANGPQSFTVKTKAGLTLEYGGTEDSRIEAQGKSVVRLWALNQMRDAKGNEINYVYSEDRTNGEFNLVYIGYSGGRRVEFVYEGRPDGLLSFEVKSKAVIGKRLQKIVTGIGSENTRVFTLGYGGNATRDSSFLTKFSDCDARSGHCLQPIAMQYHDLSIGPRSYVIGQQKEGLIKELALIDTVKSDDWRMANIFPDGRQVFWARAAGYKHLATRFNSDGTVQNWSWEGHGLGADGWQLADLFGEGRQVYWTRSGHTHYATRLNPDGTSQNWTWQGGHGTGIDGWQIADLFGDGREVYWTKINFSHYATRLNADGTVDNWTWNGHGTGADGWQLIDLFGDGRKVYWTRSGSTHYASRLNPDGTSQHWTWQGHNTGADGWGFADLFGDGRQVYWTKTGLGHFATRLNSDGTVENWTWNGHGTGADGWQLVDLFGDGRKVYWTRTGFTHYASRLNPDGTAQHWTWQGHSGGADGWGFSDLFGDGRQIYWTRIGSSHFATRLNPDGTAQNWTWEGHGTGADGSQLVDLLGDGRNAYWTRTGRQHFLTFFSAGVKNKLSRIDSGELINVVYQESADASDASGVFPSYPVRKISNHAGTVRRVTRSDGLGGSNAITHWYGDLYAEHASAQRSGSGRGVLGFRWMKSVEEATGIQTYSEFSQQWPHVGQVTKSETRLMKDGADRVLKLTESTLGCYQSEGVNTAKPGSATAACSPWAPGKVYFPFVSNTVESSWDLTAQMPTLVNTTAYGGYADQSGTTRQFGDPTQITVDVWNGGVLHRKTITNQYQPARTDGANWQSGRLKRASVTSAQY